MAACGVCRTLYPGIIPEHDDICLACRGEPDCDLDQLAVAMERELEGEQRIMVIAEIRGRSIC